MKSFHPQRRSELCGKFMAALLLARLALTSSAAIPSAEKLLPADTLLVFVVPDCTKMAEVYKKSPQGQLLNDPSMKPFCDKFAAKFKSDFLAPLERDLGVKLDDYRALAQGQFTVAVTQEEWNGQNKKLPALLLLLDTRDKSGLLKTNLANLKKRWIESGKSVRTEKIRALEFMVLPLSRNDVPKTIHDFFPQHQEVQEIGKETPKTETKTDLYIGQYESLLIVGDSSAAVEKVVAHLTGGSVPSLADEALFDADRLALFRDAPYYGWFNAKRLFDVLASLPPDQPNPDASPFVPHFDTAKVLAATGLSGLKTIAFSSHFTEAGATSDIFIGAPESTRQGFFKILSPGAKDSSPPGFVPANVVKFQRYRIDGQQAMATVEKMLNDISPQMANMFNFFMNSANQGEKDPDFNLKKNLFGNLGDDFMSWSKPRSGSDSTEIPPTIFLISSPNSEKLVAAIKSLMSLASALGEVKDRDFLGRKIYTLNMSAPKTRSRAAAAPIALSFTASGNYVAFSMDTAMLEEYLRSNEGQSKPLRELPGLAEAAQKVGGLSTGMFTYDNQLEAMRVVFDQLRKVSLADTNSSADFNPVVSSMPFARPEKSMKAWLDFSLLPDYARVSKYFSFTVFAGGTTVNGIYLRAYAPAPPGLK